MSRSWEQGNIYGAFAQVGELMAGRSLLRILWPRESEANSGSLPYELESSPDCSRIASRHGCQQALRFLKQVATDPTSPVLSLLNTMLNLHCTTDKMRLCDLSVTIRAIFVVFYNLSSAIAALWLLAPTPVSVYGWEHRGSRGTHPYVEIEQSGKLVRTALQAERIQLAFG